jgi:hydroxymethylpyrimidine/phosphomethylpyrimidine kinase
MIPIALTIAGSDPSGGAGIQADLKTFHRFDVYGTAAITLITVQNTLRLSRSEVLDAELVGEQLDAVLEDLPPNAVKTGALGSEAVVRTVAERVFPCPLVVDPILFSSSGTALLEPAAQSTLRELLLPKAALVMPNLAEAAALAGRKVRTPEEMREAARRIAGFGPFAVLVKGGHLDGGEALDILFHNGGFAEFASPRIETRHTHGTGCTYSAAITALLASGWAIEAAVTQAKAFLYEAIRSAPAIGAGAGPLNHWAKPPSSL